MPPGTTRFIQPRSRSKSRTSTYFPRLLVAYLVVAAGSVPTTVAASSSSTVHSLLLFTATAGYRHDSIPTAIEVITALGDVTLRPTSVDESVKDVRWTTTHTEDGSLFEQEDWLRQFSAIVFVHTTDVDPPGVGTVLSDVGARNLGQYIKQGGNFCGIHSAANTLYAYPWYGRTVGTFFSYHAALQNASIERLTTTFPATSTLPKMLNLTEEIYSFRSDPRQLPSSATVLLTPVAGSYSDTGKAPYQGTPHPLAWYREGDLLADISDGDDARGPVIPASANLSGGDNALRSGGGGRSFYTSLGHTNETWRTDEFQAHIFGGIAWAMALS
ncbi:class I glutamine amidotransferase-like protein [Tilletiaria anomala UBC 951]|uniref:Class I glutamine amidotransferase-like protein n=1 Tax=Tilletiaria anomala (strain ATCC 24038 / CBS 436.72 / UBC 951) TaxID=1037660 RepID=A0A066W9U4_TILAU|nr:class I glutamine amidotransferase-like protein [Tilletiaria anomala UBC 951]KDN47555.1 class I glutamine amidotransferase-like protein [Tilletiaria anomala UBC 951]